ncbi:hypothetical protein DSO57_1028629 [Entomophthora muscae]|uniref:Uncharacterized protein n=1 Tax=Entomophthora muscae TaxID=34485 RepID=A0ACC2TCW2_9FUNG|nr:hypothetical protein DSO57_1028629 [Entomophthora muscae]
MENNVSFDLHLSSRTSLKNSERVFHKESEEYGLATVISVNFNEEPKIPPKSLDSFSNLFKKVLKKLYLCCNNESYSSIQHPTSKSAGAAILGRDRLKFFLLCALWYLSSTVTNNIGKIILNQFNYPLTLTYVQFGIVSVICLVIKPFIDEKKIHRSFW